MTDLIYRADAFAAFPGKGLAFIRSTIQRIPAAQVAVKELEWTQESESTYRAIGFNAEYTIKVSASGKVAWHSRHMGPWLDADSVDTAKAAAQADYEARIRSALIAAPAQVADPAQIRARLAEWLRADQGIPYQNGVFMAMRPRTPEEMADAILALIPTPPATRKEVMPDDAEDARFDASPGVTAGAATPPADKEAERLETLPAWEVGNAAFAYARKCGITPPAVSDDVAAAARVVFTAIASEYDGADPANICGKWAWGRVRAKMKGGA